MFVCGFYFISTRSRVYYSYLWWWGNVKFTLRFAYWSLILPFSWPSHGFCWAWIAEQLGSKICSKHHDSLNQSALNLELFKKMHLLLSGVHFVLRLEYILAMRYIPLSKPCSFENLDASCCLWYRWWPLIQSENFIIFKMKSLTYLGDSVH